MIKAIARASLLALIVISFTADMAAARKRHARHVRHATAHAYSVRAYDGWWNISIVTQRGVCDRSYQFQVQIAGGYVTFQGPASITGRVSSRGGVSVSVWAGDKRASGSGRLSGTSGRGHWAGHSSTGRCSGYWVAQRY
jgi:hypothetical protein